MQTRPARGCRQLRPTRPFPMAACPPAPPQWRLCWSPWNYTSFLTWFSTHASADEQREVLGLYLVTHRQKPSEYLQARGIIPQELQPTLRLQDGSAHQLPQLPCQDVGCKRCDEGRGGWQFRWCDPRWTPSAALDLALTPQELQAEMRRPWPRGLLPPKPAPRGGGAGHEASTQAPGPQATPAAAGGRRSRKRSNRGQAAAAPLGSPSSSSSSRPSTSSGHGEPPLAWVAMAIPEPASLPAAQREGAAGSSGAVNNPYTADPARGI